MFRGRLALLVAVLLAGSGCYQNGVACVEVTHYKRYTPPEYPERGESKLVYDSSYKRCGGEVAP